MWTIAISCSEQRVLQHDPGGHWFALDGLGRFAAGHRSIWGPLPAFRLCVSAIAHAVGSQHTIPWWAKIHGIYVLVLGLPIWPNTARSPIIQVSVITDIQWRTIDALTNASVFRHMCSNCSVNIAACASIFSSCGKSHFEHHSTRRKTWWRSCRMLTNCKCIALVRATHRLIASFWRWTRSL